MIRRIRLGLVIVVCVVLQTTLFTHLRIDGVGPDVGLVAVLAVAYEDGADTGAIFGFIMGLAIDLFLTTPLGLSAGTTLHDAMGGPDVVVGAGGQTTFTIPGGGSVILAP